MINSQGIIREHISIHSSTYFLMANYPVFMWSGIAYKGKATADMILPPFTAKKTICHHRILCLRSLPYHNKHYEQYSALQQQGQLSSAPPTSYKYKEKGGKLILVPTFYVTGLLADPFVTVNIAAAKAGYQELIRNRHPTKGNRGYTGACFRGVPQFS